MTTATPAPASGVPNHEWRTVLGVAIGAAVAVALILLAFIWPTVTSSVKDVPVAIAGTAAQVDGVSRALDEKAPGGFDITRVADRRAAVALIENRTVYGAIVLGTTPELLTASANGTAVSQIFGQLAPQLQAEAMQPVKVTDIVPLASSDARGLGLTAASFPLVLGGMLGGILIALLVSGFWRRLVAIAVYALAAGFGVSAIMQAWFGILQGDFLVNALAVTLATSATATFIVGMNALLGRIGIPIGSVITMLIGNPLSSATQPAQFAPGPWGEVGQWFVPGASSTLVRDLSYFPQADVLLFWLVLAGWTLLGVGAIVAGHFRNEVVVHLPVAPEAA